MIDRFSDTYWPESLVFDRQKALSNSAREGERKRYQSQQRAVEAIQAARMMLLQEKPPPAA